MMRQGKLVFAKNMKCILVLVMILCMILTGCGASAGSSSFNQEALKYAYAFETPETAEDFPQQMIDTLGNYKVVVSGEMHYVKEHQELMSKLLIKLHEKGLRYYVGEVGVSRGYMINAYVKGQVSALEKDQYKSDEIVIEALKRFNEKLRADNRANEQITFIGFDMNHMGTEYYYAISGVGELYGVKALNDYKYALRDTRSVSGQYQALIDNFITQLASTDAANNPYQSLPASIKADLKALSLSEKKSDALRNSLDHAIREDFIYEQVNQTIKRLNVNEKMLINMGMFHAQSISEWNITEDVKEEWLAIRLKKDLEKDPNGYYNFAIATYKGTFKDSLREGTRSDFVLNSKDKTGFVQQIQKKYGNKNVFVDFKPLTGRTEKLKIDYPFDHSELAPNVHFNGLLVYPEMSVAEGATHYEN